MLWSRLLLFGLLAPWVTPATMALASDVNAEAYQVGPAHNALAAFSSDWGPKLKPLWTAKLDATVSFPLFADRNVYVLVAGSPEELVALDATTGSVVWKATAGSNSTGIAYDKQEVFSVTYGGTMTAYAARTGKLLWTLQLPGQYSFSAAPSALNGIVYTGGAGSGGTVYAVDEATGKLIWTQQVENGDNSSPAVTPTGVYVTYPCQAYDFDPKSGGLIWHYSGPCEGGGGQTPVVYQKKVYVLDYTVSNAIRDAATGALLGSFGGTLTPAIHGATGYFLDYGTLSASQPATAKLLWEFSGDGSLFTAPLAVNDWVIEGSSKGNLYVIRGTTGEVRSTTTLGGAPGLTLGAGNNEIFVPVGSALQAYGSKS